MLSIFRIKALKTIEKTKLTSSIGSKRIYSTKKEYLAYADQHLNPAVSRISEIVFDYAKGKIYILNLMP